MTTKRTESRRSFLGTTIKTTGLLTAAGMTSITPFTQSSAAQDDKTSAVEIVELPKRGEVPETDTWDLTVLFKTDDDWKKFHDDLKERLVAYQTFEGKLNDIDTLLKCLEFDAEFNMLLQKWTVYAYLRYTTDLSDPGNQQMVGLSEFFENESRQASSFIRPEILSLDEATWQKIDTDKRFDLYRLQLFRLKRQKPHTLGKSEEHLIAMTSEIAQTASNAFELLNNADLKFGTLTDETGKTVELSTGSFVVLLNSPDRNVRKTAFEKFYAGYKAHANTLASLLGSSIKKDIFYAKARKHSSAFDAALFSEEIPQTVYDMLVNTVKNYLPAMHRYYDIRKRCMKLDDLRIYDTYIPILNDITTDYPWEKGVEELAAAFKPLGDEYVKVVTKGLTTQRWSDRYENKGKRSGAFSYSTYQGLPYILMNYKTNVIDSLFTLAHEAGHSMHSHFSKTTQPFIYYRYTTFLAEVASTFNEDLLSRHLLAKADAAGDKTMRAWLVNRQIDAIRQTLFRQTMFAQFEQETHERAENGETLNDAAFRQIYGKLLRDYFGPRFALDDDLSYECFRVPHFYRAFYVYKYSTGITAALALAERVVSGGEKERNDYLTFLSGGCSKTPLDLLRDAGVDMETPVPFVAAMKRFESLVDELDKALA